MMGAQSIDPAALKAGIPDMQVPITKGKRTRWVAFREGKRTRWVAFRDLTPADLDALNLTPERRARFERQLAALRAPEPR